MNFTSVDNRGSVEGFCIIKTCQKKTSSRGDTYLDLTLSDKSGEINGKIWNYSENDFGAFEPLDIIKVRGIISKYQGADQLKIERIRSVLPEDGVNFDDLVPSSLYSGQQMFDELCSICESISDENIKKITLTLYSENKEKLLFWPAAYKLHHAIRGGLLLHTLSIVRLCEQVCKIYPIVDRDLLISGAMLHDIAKINEFCVSDAGVASGYSVRGNLIGHLADGAIMISETAKKLGIDDETVTLLEHMVISHHGDPEFGACLRPMFLEAVLLSQLDMLDATVYEINDALGALKKGDFSGRVWALDNRKLYKHDRKQDDPVKLF